MSDYKKKYRQPSRQFDDKPKFGSAEDLIRHLHGIDGSSYGAYRRVLGQWEYDGFSLYIDRIQADPYAPPSAARIRTTAAHLGLPESAVSSKEQRIASADFLARNLNRIFRNRQQFSALSIASCGSEILERSYASIGPKTKNDTPIELRIQVRMPARGRTILGRQAASIFEDELPQAMRELFAFKTNSTYLECLMRQVHTFEDYQVLRRTLSANGWVTFVADGANLARSSGISEAPLPTGVPFASPDSLRAQVPLPHAGTITGMAIPHGITVIVGGGYHGKSTVLSAIQRGVYPHIPGDGRELVATLAQAMKIRAADGRPITNVDVSPFINHLPTGSDTHHFSTQNASGSTSQAATIIESVQTGSPLLLIDEDTSATNLMIRDARMRSLVVEDQEPITPLIDRIRGLCESQPLSTILVMGGSGAYLDVADLVLQMNSYHCVDVTAQAQKVTEEFPLPLTNLPGFPELSPRHPVQNNFKANKPKTKSSGLNEITLDQQQIDVSDVEQIVDPGQTEAIAWCVRGILAQVANGTLTMAQIEQLFEERFDTEGMDFLSSFGARRFSAFLVRPRAIDVISALNRYRELAIK